MILDQNLISKILEWVSQRAQNGQDLSQGTSICETIELAGAAF
jgi:hypothetical protein